MLSFVVDGRGKSIQICFDDEGLGVLKEALERVVMQGQGHVHLCSPGGGGQALSDTSPFGESAVPEVIIDYNPA